MKPQVPLAQVGLALAGAVQSPGKQQLPVGMQAAPHGLKPPLQVKPHMPPEQVGLPFKGGVQSELMQQSPIGMHAAPQGLKPELHA